MEEATGSLPQRREPAWAGGDGSLAWRGHWRVMMGGGGGWGQGIVERSGSPQAERVLLLTHSQGLGC